MILNYEYYLHGNTTRQASIMVLSRCRGRDGSTMKRSLLFLFALACMPAEAFGADDGKGTFRVTWENDIFGGTDKGYTNGFRADYVTPKNQLTRVGEFARRNLTWLSDDAEWYETFSLGQNIYTPEDLTRRIPDPDDRPYAGFLYASFGMVADNGKRLDTIALDFGVVGRMALADDVQRAVHDLIQADDPRGWSSQLRNEPGVRLLFERKFRYLADLKFSLGDLQMGFAPHYGFALGNVDTSAAAGFMMRIGDRLDDNYGPPRVRPAVAGPGFYQYKDGLGWYLFGGLEGRAVGRNIFIEGNTFRNSASVEPHRLVGDANVGFALQYGNAEFSYTHVFRSPEFRGQRGIVQFGSLSLSVKF